MPLRTIQPATGKLLAEFPEISPAEAHGRLDRAQTAYSVWRTTSIAHRAEALRRMAAELRAHKAELGALITLEMGRPCCYAPLEIEKCAAACDYYAAHAAVQLQDEEVATGWGRSLVAFRPLGVILGIMPWNYPFWQVFRALAPALAAGNAFVLKHASSTPQCAEAIARVAMAAGLPDGLVQNLPIGSGAMDSVFDHPALRGLTFTGSTAAGRKVAARAGDRMLPGVFELGGSDPYLILADADIELAARICTKARLINAGQSCVSAKRFIVVESIRKAFEEALIENLRAYPYGDPDDPATRLGPMASAAGRDEVARQVDRSVAAGATLLLGGTTPTQPGWWYPASLLTDVQPGHAAFDEELFGPVAVIVPARDESEAVALANATEFGLGAAIFSRDTTRAEQLAREQLDCGLAFVNDHVQSDVRLPFGGIKASGFGRELSLYGLRSFVNVKTVVVS